MDKNFREFLQKTTNKNEYNSQLIKLYNDTKECHSLFDEIFNLDNYSFDQKFYQCRLIMRLAILYYYFLDDIYKIIEDDDNCHSIKISDKWYKDLVEDSDMSLKELFIKLYYINFESEKDIYNLEHFDNTLTDINEISPSSRIYVLFGSEKKKISEITDGFFDEHPFSYAYLSDCFTRYYPHDKIIISYFIHDVEHHNNCSQIIEEKKEDGSYDVCKNLYTHYSKNKKSFLFRYVNVVMFCIFHENGTYLSKYSKNILSPDLLLDILQSGNENDCKYLIKFILNSEDVSLSCKNECNIILQENFSNYGTDEYGKIIKYEIIGNILYEELMRHDDKIFDILISVR